MRHLPQTMRNYFFFLSVIITFAHCSPIDANPVPEMFRTNYGKIDDKSLPFKFGDLVQVSGSQVDAIVLDVKNEKGVNWFGLCFMQNKSLFARHIPNGYSGTCLQLLDFTYVKETGLDALERIGTVPINFNKIGIGSDGAAINKEEILRSYETGVRERQHPETPCDAKASTLQPVNGYYRNLQEVSR